MMTTIEFLSLLIMVFNAIVVAQSIKNYYKYKIPDYAIFSVAFSFGFFFGFGSVILNSLFPTLQMVTPALPHEFVRYDVLHFRIFDFFFGLTVDGTIFFLSIYFSRAIWEHRPRWIVALIYSLFGLHVLVYSPVIFGTFLHLGLSIQQATIIRSWTFFLPIFLYGFLNIKMIQELDTIPIKLDDELKPAKKIWRITFYSTLLYTLANVVLLITVHLHNGQADQSLYALPLLFVRGTATITFSFAAFIAWRYPAALLIFDAHLVRLQPYYQKIAAQQEKLSQEDVMDTDQVRQYIGKMIDHIQARKADPPSAE